MALQTLPVPLLYPSWLQHRNTISVTTTIAINGAGKHMSLVFLVPKTGNISAIGYLPGTVSGAGSLDVRLETVAGTGFPSGTLFGTNTNGASSPTSNTWAWVTLTAAAAVTRGQIVAAKLLYASGTSVTPQVMATNAPPDTGFPYTALFTTADAVDAGPLIIGIKYDDGSVSFIGNPIASSTTVSQTINTGTTPDEVGIKFTVPFSCKVSGAIYSTSAAGTTYAVKLYDGSDNLLESVTGIDGDHVSDATSSRFVLFDTDVTLSPSTVYRLTLLPEAASNITIYRLSVDASASRGGLPGGLDAMKTERTDAGAWTDTNTQWPFIGLVISALDDGAGGGGGGGPLAGGRLAQ